MQPTPIIPWLGGKRRLADKLIPLFPPHECYVEAFCGGAALYFLRPVPAPVEVINDVNGELVNLYRVVQNHLEEFVRQFKWAISSRQVFKWQQMTRPETLTDIQRAARFFYLQHHAFGGKVAGQTFGTATTTPSVNLLRIEEAVISQARHRPRRPVPARRLVLNLVIDGDQNAGIAKSQLTRFESILFGRRLARPVR